MPERYDAVLVHTYMFKQPREGAPIRSSLRGHIQVSAIAHMYHEGRVGKIFIAGGKVWGDKFPSLAEVMFAELQKKSVPGENIVIEPEAKDTPKEIDTFLERANQERWQNLASIANKTHLRRIRNIYERRKRQIVGIGAEDILEDIEVQRKHPYRHFVRDFFWSRMEMIFLAREAAVTLLYNLGFEALTTKFARSNRTQSFKVFFDS